MAMEEYYWVITQVAG